MVTARTGNIAAYARRTVIMRDGLILDDHAVLQPANATEQLQHAPETDLPDVTM